MAQCALPEAPRQTTKPVTSQQLWEWEEGGGKGREHFGGCWLAFPALGWSLLNDVRAPRIQGGRVNLDVGNQR